jgi:hypothetical protein
MFLTLYQTKLMAEPGSLAAPPDPPPEYIAPIGASINTWPNIVKNKENIDFCVGEFYHLMNRSAIIFMLLIFYFNCRRVSHICLQDPLSEKDNWWPCAELSSKVYAYAYH